MLHLIGGGVGFMVVFSGGDVVFVAGLGVGLVDGGGEIDCPTVGCGLGG
jgi:hypothetical protein